MASLAHTLYTEGLFAQSSFVFSSQHCASFGCHLLEEAFSSSSGLHVPGYTSMTELATACSNPSGVPFNRLTSLEEQPEYFLLCFHLLVQLSAESGCWGVRGSTPHTHGVSLVTQYTSAFIALAASRLSQRGRCQGLTGGWKPKPSGCSVAQMSFAFGNTNIPTSGCWMV